nr:hypothetical protein CFP56_67225 [Quercus suber]
MPRVEACDRDDGGRSLGFCISETNEEICGVGFSNLYQSIANLRSVAFDGGKGFVRPSLGGEGIDGLGLNDGCGEGRGGSEIVKGEVSEK